MSTPAPENAIEVRGLVKTYPATRRTGPKEALKGIDLDVPRGSILGLLGPNGAGKSTFINILAGLVIKTSGTVRIWGFDQDRNPRQARAAIGVVPQELNIDPFFNPIESLEVQAGLYGVPKSERRSMEILGRVGLAEHARAYARSLSGGMRRRLLVAKALVQNPSVLVLDEPTAGVDIELRRMLWDYVRELHASGTTVILTTHYLEEAEAMCDRIAILNEGSLVALDTPDELRATVGGDSITIETDEAEALCDDIARQFDVRPLVVDGEVRLEQSDGHRWIARLMEAFPGRIQSVRLGKPTLEDVFIARTGHKFWQGRSEE